MESVVIVGASLAGAKAAETLRAEGFTGRVVLIGEETELPYERPPLSKGYLLGNDPRDGGQVHDQPWYAEQNIDLRLGTRVVAVDRHAHTVALADGQSVPYDRLLLATGSRVRRLDVPGSENSGVRYLRTLPDSDQLRADLKPGTQVVVVGAGWIGLEVAAAARSHGCTVAVIETESLPLRRVLGDELGGLYRDLHAGHGVEFHLDSGVREFGGLDGQVTDVVLTDGTEIPADLIVVGVGIRPATELAEACGLDLDNGIAVDSHLRTSDPDIFACGDVAAWNSRLVGSRIRVEHWANALNGGPAAAKSILDRDEPYDPVPYFYSDQYDLSMEYSGYVPLHGYDRIVVRGDLTVKPDGTAPEFLAFWISGERVLAGMNGNVWDVVDPIQDLVRAGYRGQRVDLRKLADPTVPLTDVL
ncbi:3-phenylpropionate/trans-cinnamate dioxygenase ferredoxin reductase subunit [Hamadaea flava]|uniref:NAD(P)/FAD-dependent oxidoreductase n=1 Tax=Hamadaea flava TaxID=1742688 RepID=A0ABV8LRQ3_9ACTN|nr:FAD-dependent oxidoreductase [Hamadaea flava]MCP2321781.1 3-phenylpropionate/trans-cinnamate dioxygenase ferredoxin reductase subunit [Hamadaea flava]